MNTQLMNVSPSLAQAWLSNNPNNRRKSSATIELYAREMKNGRWEITHQGIGIYEDGSLADGQHRLEAVVASGCVVQMMVTTGMPLRSSSGIDAHRARSVNDIIKIGGSANWLTQKMQQTVKQCFDIKKVGAEEMILLANSIEDSLVFSSGLFDKNIKGVTASLRAAVTLAHYYGADEQRLADFVAMFYSGIVKAEGDSAVIKFRDYMTMRSNSSGGDGTVKMDMGKAQNAIFKFLKHEDVKVLREPKELIYPKLNPNTILDI